MKSKSSNFIFEKLQKTNLLKYNKNNVKKASVVLKEKVKKIAMPDK